MVLLITGAWQGAKEHIPELEERGHRVHFLQYEKDELPCSPDQIEGVICNGLFLFHEISDFTNLRYIQLTSAGFDRVPMKYVREQNIEIHNARGVYSIPMAEFAIAGVLSLYKKLDVFRENQKQHKWEKQRDLLEINGKTVCIFGCGSVGCECAKRFSAFGARVIGVDIVTDSKTEYGFEEVYPLSATMESIRQSDIIVSTLPLLDSTYHFWDTDRFSMMKPESVFVNISRGKTVDTDTMISALKEKKIAGAVLDVFEEEPLDEKSVLWDLDNIFLSPHNSFVGENNKHRLFAIIMKYLEERGDCDEFETGIRSGA